MPFSNTMATMAAASAHSPTTPEMIAATIRIQITSSLNWASSFFQSGMGGASASSLWPYRAIAAATSVELKPCTRSLPNDSKTLAALAEYGSSGRSCGTAWFASIDQTPLQFVSWIILDRRWNATVWEGRRDGSTPQTG